MGDGLRDLCNDAGEEPAKEAGGGGTVLVKDGKGGEVGASSSSESRMILRRRPGVRVKRCTVGDLCGVVVYTPSLPSLRRSTVVEGPASTGELVRSMMSGAVLVGGKLCFRGVPTTVGSIGSSLMSPKSPVGPASSTSRAGDLVVKTLGDEVLRILSGRSPFPRSGCGAMIGDAAEGLATVSFLIFLDGPGSSSRRAASSLIPRLLLHSQLRHRCYVRKTTHSQLLRASSFEPPKSLTDGFERTVDPFAADF